MSRDNDRIVFRADPGAASAATTQTMYFVVGSRPVMIKEHYWLPINPAAVNGDTLAITWDYATDGSAFATLDAVAAAEYNDTDDTFGTTALVPVAADSAVNTRVPAGAVIRCRIVWTGTVTDGQIESYLIGTTL